MFSRSNVIFLYGLDHSHNPMLTLLCAKHDMTQYMYKRNDKFENG
jgi:hypothetical protein